MLVSFIQRRFSCIKIFLCSFQSPNNLKIIYHPKQADPTLLHEFGISHPVLQASKHKTYVFTAPTFADIIKDMRVLMVFEKNEEGEFDLYEYKGPDLQKMLTRRGRLAEWSKAS